MIRQLSRIGTINVEDRLVRFHLEDGQEITPGKWIAFMKRGNVPLIKASFEDDQASDLAHESSSSSSLSSSATSLTSQSTRNDSISLDESTKDEDIDDETEDRGFLFINSEPKIKSTISSFDNDLSRYY